MCTRSTCFIREKIRVNWKEFQKEKHASLHCKSLQSESIQHSRLDSRYIESIEYIGFDFFVQSCDDQEPNKDKNNSEYSLEPSALIGYNAKSRNNRTPNNRDDHKHE